MKDMALRTHAFYAGQARKHHPPEEIRKRVPGTVLTPIRAAELLNISVSEMKRRASEGIYPYYTDHRGWRWFAENELRALSTIVTDDDVMRRRLDEKLRRASKPGPNDPVAVVPPLALKPLTAGYSDETAQKVFAKLEEGARPIKIVIELGVNPETVDALSKIYARMNSSILLDNELKSAIEKLPLQGELPIVDGSHLLKILQKTLAMPSPCARCGNQKARICTGCAAPPVETAPPQRAAS